MQGVANGVQRKSDYLLSAHVWCARSKGCDADNVLRDCMVV